MEITVRIPDQLAAQAKAHGVSLEAYVEALLAQQVGSRHTASRPRHTAEEVHSWLDSLAQFSDKIPPLPDTISRE